MDRAPPVLMVFLLTKKKNKKIFIFKYRKCVV